MDFAKRIGLRKPKWDDPAESIGERLGDLRAGKYTCWQPVGRARVAWNAIRPNVKKYLDDFCPPSCSSLILELYMIGKTQETAAPTILICSSDKSTRKTIRKLIKDNGFLDRYPGIGLGDTEELPDQRKVKRMARTDDDTLSSPSSSASEAQGNEPMLGRQLIFTTASGKTRLATGGPIVWINEDAYQPIVGHVLVDEEPNSELQADTPLSDDASFDGDSDAEDDEGDPLGRGVPSDGSRTPDDLLSEDTDDEYLQGAGVSSISTQMSHVLVSRSVTEPESTGNQD
ncbi:hypothetical protein B0H63DRAFT_184053 [Podospora didyma]|uniref:Uncharacterized protein n=1 Tax=Podospora didyma TaxID=330526 RepID=A0AAE0TZY8_9PEZI|nr:hypothetical protein B0H63DRAFT_184053 [Podospora didyma]